MACERAGLRRLDQGVDNGDAVAGRMHDHGVEVDGGDGVGVVDGELGERNDQVGDGIDVGGCTAAGTGPPS